MSSFVVAEIISYPIGFLAGLNVVPARQFNLRATGWDESSSRGRAGDTTTLRNAKFQLAAH